MPGQKEWPRRRQGGQSTRLLRRADGRTSSQGQRSAVFFKMRPGTHTMTIQPRPRLALQFTMRDLCMRPPHHEWGGPRTSLIEGRFEANDAPPRSSACSTRSVVSNSLRSRRASSAANKTCWHFQARSRRTKNVLPIALVALPPPNQLPRLHDGNRGRGERAPAYKKNAKTWILRPGFHSSTSGIQSKCVSNTKGLCIIPFSFLKPLFYPPPLPLTPALPVWHRFT